MKDTYRERIKEEQKKVKPQSGLFFRRLPETFSGPCK